MEAGLLRLLPTGACMCVCVCMCTFVDAHDSYSLIHFMYTCNVCTYTSLQVSTQSELADDPCKDTKYQETSVDTMRAQKDEVKLQ